MDSDNSGSFAFNAAEDNVEANAPGAVVQLNNNGNQGDIERGAILVDPMGRTGWQVQLIKTTGFKLWGLDAKQNCVGEFKAASVTSLSFCVEGITQGAQQMTANLIWNSVIIATDYVRLLVSDVDIKAYTFPILSSATPPEIVFPSIAVPENKEEVPGALVRRNIDDDNNNDVKDSLESNVAGEDDLVSINVSTRQTAGVKYRLRRGDLNLRVWTSSAKTTAVLTSGDSAEITPGDQTFYVEWIGDENSTTIGDLYLETLTHTPAVAYTNNIVVTQDLVKFTVADIDVDIDSDNNGVINHSLWEDELESSPYGFGKLIFRESSVRTPVEIQLTIGLGADTLLDIDGTSVLTGTIWLWDAAQGGNRIFAADNPYPLTQLDYDPTTGKVNLFVEAKTFNTQFTKLQGLEDSAQPDDRILVTAYRDYGGLGLRVPYAKDSVKYAVVQANTIYPEMVTRQVVRHELAARGVYGSVEGGGQDLPKVGLKKLSPVELLKLKLPPIIVANFGGSSTATGLVVEMYQDYTGTENQFVLAFRGTDFTQADDLFNNAWQAANWFAPQYDMAMAIGAAVRDTITDETSSPLALGNVKVTGHSLGGGLAGAAAVVGDFRANTFNSAGLLRNTLIGDNGAEKHAGSLSRYDNAWQTIDEYYVDWDLLHLIQSLPGAQPAIGYHHEMDGPFDAELLFDAALFATLHSLGVGWAVAAVEMGIVINTLKNAHLNSAVLYGLLVDEDDYGNIVRDLLGYQF